MLVIGVVIAILAAGVLLLVSAYRSRTPTVLSRLSGGRVWPWITAVILLLVPITYLAFSYGATLIANRVDEPPDTGRPPTWWEYVGGAGVLLLFILVLWLARFRPFAAANLLLAGWVAIPASMWAQMSLDFHLDAPERANAPSGMVIIGLFIALSPSFLVALLLIASARNLDGSMSEAPAPDDVVAERAGHAEAAHGLTRTWAVRIVVMKGFASLLLALGVVALVLLTRWNVEGFQAIMENWAAFLLLLGVTLVLVAGLLWFWPLPAALALLSSGAIVVGIVATQPLLNDTGPVPVILAALYAVPALFVSGLLFLIAGLQRRQSDGSPLLGDPIGPTALPPEARTLLLKDPAGRDGQPTGS